MKLRKRLMSNYLRSYLYGQYKHIHADLRHVSYISLIRRAQHCGLWR